MAHPCACCAAEVEQRQEALQCDSCDSWQHRKCNSGISRPDYRRLVRGEMDIGPWFCAQCRGRNLPADDTAAPLEAPDHNYAMVVQEQDEAASRIEEEMEDHEEHLDADRSFEVSGPLGQLPNRREDSLHDSLHPEMILPDVPITFEEIPGGATAGGWTLLADSRQRAALRPKHPLDLAFELDMGHIPNAFLRRDIQLEGQRHLIFATDGQLKLLSDAITWYMDGTFKLARHPFVQLFTIHSFICSGDVMKQVPLCFVMMSRRRVEDYRAVFNAVLDMLPRAPRLEEAVLDFERAVWSALPEVFPDIEIFGCWFHWAQALYRKIKAVGLQTAYSRQPGVRQYLKELMALPNIPPGHIVATFEELKRCCPVNTTSPALAKVLEYLEVNWVKNAACPPTAWSTFQRAVRTNNDVEGWHRRMNLQAVKDHPNLYLVVGLLHTEASRLPLQVRLVCQQVIERMTSKQQASKQAKLERLWASYEQMSKSNYLRQCAALSDHSES